MLRIARGQHRGDDDKPNHSAMSPVASAAPVSIRRSAYANERDGGSNELLCAWMTRDGDMADLR
jgi:hypothetical protein